MTHVVHPDRPPPHERTKASWGLLGFYTSCALVSIGAAVGACGYAWFGSVPALVIGSVMVLGSGIGCFVCLRRARH